MRGQGNVVPLGSSVGLVGGVTLIVTDVPVAVTPYFCSPLAQWSYFPPAPR